MPASAPELAYSWPAVLFGVAIAVVFLCIFGVVPRWSGYVALVVPFAMCPVRDWMLDRYWPGRVTDDA